GKTGAWLEMKKGESTSDSDIRARRALFIDVDSRRPKGTSATDDQVRAALAVADMVQERIERTTGANTIAVGMSGNGASLFGLLANLLESPELHATVRGILAALRALHATAAVEIDVSVSDAKRLCPAF